MTEIEAAKRVAKGEGPVPAPFYNSWLAALRISGTGVAWREAHGEFTWRERAGWLGPQMLRRAVGLPVVVHHPERSGLLDADAFAGVIGIIIHAYAREDELWGVGRFFDRDVAEAVSSVDTSPAVAFAPGETTRLTLGDGAVLLVEGLPALLDHVALVQVGTWSKGKVRGFQTKEDADD